MPYSLEVSEICEDDIRARTRKNALMEIALRKKITQILENPYHFKPLRAPLQGQRRVHVLGSFVLAYEIHEERKAVRLLRFEHHDEAYSR